MANTNQRQVKENYWYTSAQITDVGEAWAIINSQERVFLYDQSETTNQTAFKKEHVPKLEDLPKKILLPFNKGKAHWTAITIEVRQNPDSKVQVNICYTDSLNADEDFQNHEKRVGTEIERIKQCFRQQYREELLSLSSSVYPHTWTQSDISSCGPYSLANGIRCLEGAGTEPNPGRKKIREEQLNMMRTPTAIKGCSTSNKMDEILSDWILHQTQENLSVEVTTEDDCLNICLYYSNKYTKDLNDIIQIFYDESSGVNFRPRHVNMRIQELFSINNSVKKNNNSPNPRFFKRTSPEIVKPTLCFKSIAEGNICQKLEEIYQILFQNSPISSETLDFIEYLTRYMCQSHLDENENYLNKILTLDEIQKATCKKLISEIIQMIRSDENYKEKLVNLNKAYFCLAKATTQVKSMSDPMNATNDLIKAHIVLLEGAIKRNQASLIRKICFAIQDFCSALLELISGGIWESDIKGIETIREKLQQEQGQKNITSEQLKREKEAIETILTAKESLVEELGREPISKIPENASVYA